MSNLAVSSFLSAVPTALSADLPTSANNQSSGSSLYPKVTASSQPLPQYADTPVVLFRTKGDDAMQQVGPKAPPGTEGPSGYQTYSPSSACEDGALANAGQAAGQLLGSEAGPSAEWALGAEGKWLGGALCDVIDSMPNPFDTGPDNLYDPAQEWTDPSDPGATGGQSAGTTGGYSKDPGDVGGSSSMDSYIDPTTGEPITNKDGQTIAGDPNADQGTYLGEVDDPSFVQDQSGSRPSSSTNSSSSTDQSSSTSTDKSSQSTEQSSDSHEVQETQQSSDPNGPKPNDGDMPADDGSGSTGPAGPRMNVYSSVADKASNFYMPADDSAGGGTPRSNTAVTASVAGLSAFQAVVLSRAPLM